MLDTDFKTWLSGLSRLNPQQRELLIQRLNEPEEAASQNPEDAQQEQLLETALNGDSLADRFEAARGLYGGKYLKIAFEQTSDRFIQWLCLEKNIRSVTDPNILEKYSQNPDAAISNLALIRMGRTTAIIRTEEEGWGRDDLESRNYWDDKRDQWNPAWNVGIGVIDEDHKRLIGIINRLRDAQMKTTMVRQLLPALIAYTATHFNRERKLLEKAGYPRVEEHIVEHQFFIKRLSIIKREMESLSDPKLPKEVETFLFEWLYQHIMIEDKQFGLFLNVQGVV
ncbi:MAG: hemerythrin family protein [Magnetococcales bacterium]|nr:hemerythrin family protein [Magnetococcales bacterium]